MAKTYPHQKLEEKWLQTWNDQELFQDTANQDGKDKMYLLFAFAYPSGSGLHVGHVESKTALDILARHYRMSGKDVFFPVGWDAFGLPAENYAIKTGIRPAETTVNAIETFRRQIKRVGISYDWANELATSHPGYYKWTQWIFLQLFKKGLAYKKPGLVNWCPSCQTVLANEQVVDGHCERCDHEVIQKQLDQWYFKITDYKDELIEGLDQVDWPKPTEEQQKNWIGRSQGANIFWGIRNPDLPDSSFTIKTFTTRFDTIPGVTYVVVAPEFPALNKLITKEKEAEIKAYLKDTEKLSQRDRMVNKDKTGVFTGSYAINPFDGKEVPIYVANYVIAGYGTGAVMGMPGHDQRDYDFAQKFGLPQIFTTKPKTGELPTDGPYEGTGIQINSGTYNGLTQEQAKEKIIDSLVKADSAEIITQYKLRDWLISRQRYWGAPIPIVYDPEGVAHPVKEDHLPWMLPEDVEFRPNGESPLKLSKALKDRVEKLYGKGWTPEYDTMDTFVDSSWYFLRFPEVMEQKSKLDPSTRQSLPQDDKKVASNTQQEILGWDRDWSQDTNLPFDKEKLKTWLPVDFYMIGPEHIVLHLLYARFFTKFLRDEGYLDFDEPFQKMRHQGMILGPDHKKMSKSKGNVIDPDKVIEEFGADTLRMYEMFMGPIEADKPWDTRSVIGVYRFLTRVYELVESSKQSSSQRENERVTRKLHQTIEKISQDIPQLKFNTAIAAMMEFVNVWEAEAKSAKSSLLSQSDLESFIKLLAPFAPFMAEELWQTMHADSSEFISVHQQSWPDFDPALIQEDTVTVVIQINGKVRSSLDVQAEMSNHTDKILALAKADERVAKWVNGKKILKEIFIPGTGNRQTLVNLVVGQ